MSVSWNCDFVGEVLALQAVFELPLLSIRTAFSAKIKNEFWVRGCCNLPSENSLYIIQYEHNVTNTS